MIRFLLLLLSLPVLAFSQGSTNDYLLSQKPASGPLVVRPVTPAVGQLLGWPTSINTPAAITLGTGLSLSGSTLNATAGTPAWGDITGIPAAVTNLSGTNTGDNAVNSNYSGLVTNATHTGDATGATALTLATVNSNVGSFGSATAAPAITVNAKGLVTAVTTHTITPAWGDITGIPAAVTNLSGTNTGDQTITLTGDVTGSGTGSFAATIANDAVTFAKMQEISGTHLVGRHGSGSGNIQEVSVGEGVEFQGSGIRRSALTGDVTAPAGNNTTTLATVNSNVGSFGSATAAPAVTVNAKGLVTAVTTNTITPAVGSITGLGTGVSTFLGTPTLANLNTAVSDADLATTGANTFTGLQQFSGTTHAGLRLNNLTTAERDALSSPAAGMAIWNTTDGRLQLHNGSSWTSGMVRLSGDTMTGDLTLTDVILGRHAAASLRLGTPLESGWVTQQISPAGAIVGTTVNGNPTNNLVLTNAISTGTGANASAIVFSTYGTNGSSGSAIGTLSERLRITTSGGIRINGDTTDTITRRADIGMVHFHGQSGTGTGIGGPVSPGVNLGSGAALRWTNDTPASTADVTLSRAAANTLQLGTNTATASATAIGQTIKGPNATGTTSTGGSLTIAGGTGTSAGGAVIISTAATTTQATAVTVNKDGVTTFAKPPVLPVYTVATLPATAAAGMVQGAHAVVTDATDPTYLGALTGGGAVVCPVFYNGTAWVSH